MARDRITGTLAAAVTPLRDDGRRLDEDAFPPLLEFYGAAGVDGVLALGTTGEGVLLEPEERRRVAQLVVNGAGPLAVIVHCGAQSTAQTTSLAAHAAEIGAHGVAVIAPPYFLLTPYELLEHLTAAAAACAPLPFYVYEYADRSGYTVPPDVVRALRDRAENLAGMKVSDAPFAKVEPYLDLDLDIFIGAEPVIPDALARGAVGSVSGVAAAFPETVAELVREPTPDRARLVESLRRVLSVGPFQASVKAALGLRGVPVRGDVRGPLRPLPSDAVRGLAEDLQALLGEQALAERPAAASAS